MAARSVDHEATERPPNFGVRPWPRLFPLTLGKRRTHREAHREAAGRGPQEGSGCAFPGARKPVHPRRRVRLPRRDGPDDVRAPGVGDARHLPARWPRPTSRTAASTTSLNAARADAPRRLAAVRARRCGRRTARLGRAGAPEARPAEPEAGLQADQPEVGRTPHLLAAQPGRARQEHRQALDRLRRRRS